MARFRSTPQEVEAVQWDGENTEALLHFGAALSLRAPGGLQLLAGKNGAQGWVPVPVWHWIVRNSGDLSHYWPVDPDYFARKYELVKEDS